MVDARERITGKLNCAAWRDKAGNVIDIKYNLVGGNVIGMTAELMDNLDPRWVTRAGNTLTFGQYTAEIIEHIEDGDWYLVEVNVP